VIGREGRLLVFRAAALTAGFARDPIGGFDDFTMAISFLQEF